MMMVNLRYTLTAVFLLLTLVFPFASPESATAQGSVVMRLVPSATSLIAGSTYTVTVQLETGTQQVAGADAFINFDPTYAEVTALVPVKTKLGVVANNNTDSNADEVSDATGLAAANAAGNINYSALKSSGQPFATGTFSIATITFLAKTHVASTSFSLNQSGSRISDVAMSGNSVLGALP